MVFMNEMNFFFRELCGESLSTFNKLYRKVLHCESEGSSKDTHRENRVSLNSVQEFIEIEACLLMTFFLFL